ncbi:MAG TPA: ribonuclease J [Patescibacteria group bacterium]|nr:ribonuclease J [Patescibacteria group bacterium]
MQDTLSLIPLGGVGNVTKNMYIYEYKDQILLVDCGLGFADETMLGVDLLMPDISYLLKTQKKIVGMLITHGHEDHMGALPFILPQLPEFPIFATPLTAAFANGKLKEFGITRKVQTIEFGPKQEVKIGVFSAYFMRVTHSVPDTSHIFIKTPVGNIYHGSDFKFDLTPADGKKTDFAEIVAAGNAGVLAMLSDSLGAEREGQTPSEEKLAESFDREMARCKGKMIITTYSSNISRLNQAIWAAQKYHKQVCFVGRSLIKNIEIAKQLGLIVMPKGMEVRIDQLRKIKDTNVVLFVAGSQGQENSAMTRIANGQHKDITLRPQDSVIFSSDPIPGNEVMVNSLVDTIARVGARVMYTDISREFHVSGHGSAQELMLLMSLVRPQFVVPIGGTYKQMVAYKGLARRQGFADRQIMLLDNGQEMVLGQNQAHLGQRYPVRNVYVDQISGEEVESFVLRDRQKISSDGIIVLMAEIDSETGGLLSDPDIITRGFSTADAQEAKKILLRELKKTLVPQSKKSQNWAYLRKIITDVSEKALNKELKRKPLILPAIIEL